MNLNLDWLFQFIPHKRYFIVLLLSRSILGYSWLENDDNFDCVVGISVDDINVSIGVFISIRTVITSANPLNRYLNSTKNNILIYSIDSSFNISEYRRVRRVAGNQSFRRRSWVAVGFDSIHSTIHDIALINVIEADRIIKKKIEPGHEKGYRQPVTVNLPKYDSSSWNKHRWVFAGFGYADKEHIRENNVLQVTYLDSGLANCDEYIPREWGHFICILDNQDLAGLASGAPLFYEIDLKTVRGIGSFGFKKDKEKIFVFTNLLPYVKKLYGYLSK